MGVNQPQLNERGYLTWAEKFNRLYGSNELNDLVRNQFATALSMAGATYPIRSDQAASVFHWLQVAQIGDCQVYKSE